MKERRGEHPLGDAGQGVLLAAFLIVWVGDSFFLKKSTFVAQWVPLAIRLAFLVLTLITAFYLLRSAHNLVTHDPRPDHVVTTGAFRYVRHPLYLASILTYLGLTVSTASLFCLVMSVVIFAFHDYIAGYEERLLEIRFGEEYKSYRSRTGKWVPRRGRGCPGSNRSAPARSDPS